MSVWADPFRGRYLCGVLAGLQLPPDGTTVEAASLQTSSVGGGAQPRGHAVTGFADAGVDMCAVVHYARWEQARGRKRLAPGAFGEHLTVRGFDEHDVCVGDVLELGRAVVQVSGPRTVARSNGARPAGRRLPHDGAPGWHCRVLQEGEVAVGEYLYLTERLHPKWTVVRVRHLARGAGDPAAARALVACPELAPRWRTHFSSSLA